jgi:CBS domain-containing protein
MDMTSLDALTTSHLRQLLRPRRAAWFESHDEHDRPLQTTIGSLVQATPCAVEESTPLGHVQELLVERHLTAVPVIDPGSSLCGVVTCSDLLRAGADWTAADAMSSAVTIRASASVEAAAQLVANERTDHVVVTDAVGQPIGIVTANAIVRFLAERPR